MPGRQAPAPTLVQGWGPRSAPLPGASTFHRGQDRIGYGNTAPEDGVVVSFVYAGALGNLLTFDGDSGTRHLLGHNASGGLRVPVGSRQARNTRLTVQGMTGLATGVHVHWETRPDHVNPIDPAIWLGTTSGAGSGGATPIEGEQDMPRLIRNYDGSIGLVTDAGELQPISSMNEVESLRATGLVGAWVQMADGNVWNTLAARTARLRAGLAVNADVDEAAVAAALAPLVVGPILAALQELDGVSLTPEQLEAATESAIRKVFADAAQD